MSETLAKFVVALSFEDLSESVIKAVKKCILDTVGCAILGSTVDEGQRVRSAVADFDHSRDATIWGTSQMSSVPFAALVNGTAAHSRELDDACAFLHPGAVIIPAVFAVAEKNRSSGKAVITSIVAGYEIMIRLSEAMGSRSQYDRGWHPTGTCGAFGSAAAVAKLLDLGSRETTSALGLAGSYCGGTTAFLLDGAMSKKLHPGKAAEMGIVAGFLANKGFTGPKHIIDSDWGGLFSTYMSGIADKTRLTDELGDRFRITQTHFKLYACCLGVQSTVNSILELRRKHDLHIQEIDEVVIRGSKATRQIEDRISDIRTTLDAQMSVRYGIAVALLNGDASIREYSEQMIANPKVMELVSKMRVVVDPSFDDNDQPGVEIKTQSGEKIIDKPLIPKGHPANPASDKELVKKFRDLASFALTAPQIEEIVKYIQTVESFSELSKIHHLLAGESP